MLANQCTRSFGIEVLSNRLSFHHPCFCSFSSPCRLVPAMVTKVYCRWWERFLWSRPDNRPQREKKQAKREDHRRKVDKRKEEKRISHPGWLFGSPTGIFWALAWKFLERHDWTGFVCSKSTISIDRILRARNSAFLCLNYWLIMELIGIYSNKIKHVNHLIAFKNDGNGMTTPGWPSDEMHFCLIGKFVQLWRKSRLEKV